MDINYKEIIEKYKNKRIAVVYGGWSNEREISILTGKAILNSLLALNLNAIGIDLTLDNLDVLDKKDFDLIYIALHGRGGEDGKLQAYLDLKDLPYTGPKFLASGIAMSKFYTKNVLLANGVSTAKFFKIDMRKESIDLQNILKFKFEKNGLNFPVVAKPVNEGSAVGVHIVENFDQLFNSIKEVSKIDNEILIEKYIKGREFTVGIVGDLTLPVLEIVSDNKFYDFEAKYKNGKSKHFVPKDVDKKILEQMQLLAQQTFDSVGCSGVGRVDIMMEGESLFVLEINTIPGMTETSLLPYAANEIGISFEELVLLILDKSLS